MVLCDNLIGQGLLNSMAHDPFGDAGLTNIIDSVQSIAVWIAVPFTVLALFWTYYKETMGSGATLKFNKVELMRILFILFLLSSYRPASWLLDTLANGVNAKALKTLQKSFKNYQKTQFVLMIQNSGYDLTDQDIEELKNKATDNIDENTTLFENYIKEKGYTEGNFFTGGMFTQAYWTRLITTLIWTFALVIKFATLMILAGVDKILICLGPIALAVSLIWRNQIMIWLGTWLAAKFSFVTFMVIEAVMNIYQANNIYAKTTGSEGFNSFVALGTAFASAVLCLLALFLTSRVIGSADTGKITATALQAGRFISDAINSNSRGGGDNQNNEKDTSGGASSGATNAGGKSIASSQNPD